MKCTELAALEVFKFIFYFYFFVLEAVDWRTEREKFKLPF